MSELVEVDLLLLEAARSGRSEFFSVRVDEVLGSGYFLSADIETIRYDILFQVFLH